METTNPASSTNTDPESHGSKDGSTAADNDQPYRFGLRPTVKARFPFTERQFARLLILRGRVQDEPVCAQEAAA